VVLQVISPPEKREELIALIFRENYHAGRSFLYRERRVQTREWVDVTTSHGVVRIKTAANGFAPNTKTPAKSPRPQACRLSKFSPKPSPNI